jgi:hypothetical protein
MIRQTLSRLVAAVSLASALGCASSGTGAAGAPAEEERVTPPRRISQGAPPELTIYSIPPSGRSPIRVSYEVLIDAAGRPDMKTFKVSGPGAAENREALARWIESSAWAPATRGGQPVPHVYRGSLQVQVRRG